MKYFVIIISLIIAIGVVAGFFIVGSPQEERLRKFDERRAQDLQTIQQEIINYWTSKEQLPNTLADLRDDIRGFVPPKDPETGVDYSYEVKDKQNLVVTLCANFARPSPNISVPRPAYPEPYYQQSWEHKEGYVCFERKIDPEIYKPQKPIRGAIDF